MNRCAMRRAVLLLVVSASLVIGHSMVSSSLSGWARADENGPTGEPMALPDTLGALNSSDFAALFPSATTSQPGEDPSLPTAEEPVLPPLAVVAPPPEAVSTTAPTSSPATASPEPSGSAPLAEAGGAPASPQIVENPQSQNTCPGCTTVFSVSAGGSGLLAYQWQKDGADLANGGDIAGADTMALMVFNTSADDVGAYRCKVSSTAGTVTSEEASLNLKETVAGDLDGDCDVDNADLQIFEACATGPAVAGPPVGCSSERFSKADLDDDGDVDQSDFGIVQLGVTGFAASPTPPIIVAGGDFTVNPGGPYAGSRADRVDGGWTFTFSGSVSPAESDIAQWAWDFGDDTLDGPWLNTYKWNAQRAYNDDMLICQGPSDWSSAYAFTRETLSRQPGASFQARVTSYDHHQVWGLKNTGTNYHYNQMPYAFYFYNGELRIYESGNHRSTPASFSWGVPVDLRIDLKQTAGARYYYRPLGAADWTLLRDSSHNADTEFVCGYTAHQGQFVMDNVRHILGGQTVTHKVYKAGSVILTATDADGKTGSASAEVVIQNPSLTANVGGPYAGTAANRSDAGWTFQFDSTGSSGDYEIVQSLWSLGTDTLDGPWLNTYKWNAERAYNDDMLICQGPGGWGGAYVFTRDTLSRRTGASFQARVASYDHHQVWGLKNTGTNYHYNQMPYAFYFYNGELRIYESGNHRSTPASFSWGVPVDLRIDLKQTAGARYYYRPQGAANWTLLYDSYYNGDPEFVCGYTAHQGRFVMDDVVQILAGPPAAPFEHKVYTAGPASLTVRDSTGQASTASFEVTVDPPLPTANAGGPYVASEADIGPGGFPLVLDGSSSTSARQLVQYEWDFGVDDFDGKEPDADHYFLSSPTFQDDRLIIYGSGGWGNRYAYNKQVLRRASTMTVTARVSSTGHAMWGLKNTSADYHHNQMPYAVYLNENSRLYIYESGSDRGDVGTYVRGEPLDLRIVLNSTVGAKYYKKAVSETEWTLLYDSFSGSSTEFLAGVTVYNGTFKMDDLSLKYYDQPLSLALRRPGSIKMTVTDSAGRTSSSETSFSISGASPVAVTGGPYLMTETDLLANGVKQVTFDGSQSTDDVGIVRYLWDFGIEAFDGALLNSTMWSLQNGSQNDRLMVTGTGGWGGAWAFERFAVSRGKGMTLECQVVPTNHAMVGFKNTSQDFNYPQLVYALYFANGGLNVYEDGSNRGQVWSYTGGKKHDIRIILKETAGATYWVRESGAGAWIPLYDSNYGSAVQFLRGVTVHSGSFELDNLVQQFPLAAPVFPVTRATTATLTVTDAAGRSDTSQTEVIVEGNPPVADAGALQVVPLGAPALLDGTRSTDDYGIVQARWDCGDGGTALGLLTHHRYTTAGTYTATLTVIDAAGRMDSATTTIEVVPMVVTVPWDYDRVSKREIPHNVWSNLSARLKAVAFTDTPADQLTYTWDFGDGSAPVTGAVTDKRVIETFHAYTGSPGTLFTAALTVHDPVYGDLIDVYPVQIHDRDLTIEVNVAIEEGLWWLHKAQEAGGTWPSYGSYRSASTASAVQAMAINGHVPTRSVSIDPLVDDVVRGLNVMLTYLSPTNISAQAYGNPDSNGNGIGIGVNEGQPIYQGGMVMDALAASGAPDMAAQAEAQKLAGRTYRSILQDMVDMYSWGQGDAESGYNAGGWRYNWNDGADNSACQWAAIGYMGALTFGLDAPDWVKQRNRVWLNYSYNGTGFGYTGAGNDVATTPSGMVQLAFAGVTSDESQWRTAEAWIANNWNWWRNQNNVYAYYAFVKAMRLARPQSVANLRPTGLDWYHADSGLVRHILGRQQSDGGWPDYYGRQFATAWQVIILTPTLFTRPPVAAAGPDIVWAFDRPLVLDGSKSYHTDPVRVLVQYEWDFDGDGVYDYIGTDPAVEHTYVFDSGITYPITYTVILRVTDDIGQTDTDTRLVTIAEPPHAPFAMAGGPYTANVGVPFHPDGSGSYDIDPTDYITRQEWDFNGNNGYNFDTPDAAVDCAAPPDGCLQVTWTFTAPGIYNIGLRVWDNAVLHPENKKLASSPDFTTVTVLQNQGPVADAGGPYSVDECRSLPLDGSASSDPDGNAITYAWDLDGDGEHDDATGPAPTWTWPADGIYTVSLIVSDGALQSAPVTAQVTVRDTAPTVTLAGPETLNITEPGVFEATVTSPCDAVNAIDWDWDYDGIEFRPSGETGESLDHAYSVQGDYTVAVRVTDADGSTAIATTEVLVAPPPGPRKPAGKRIKVVIGRRDFDVSRQVHRAQFTLVSEHPDPIAGPIVLAFDNLKPATVTLLDPDGTVNSPEVPQKQMPYVDFSSLLTGNVLPPGASIGPQWIEFADPGNASFTFDAIPYLFNTPPRITSTAVTTAGEGRRYRYDVDAVDDDGDPIVFRLRSTGGTPPPEGMTINPISGLVDWVPSQTAAGEHAITVSASDQLAGGDAEQAFIIVVSQINVAPTITSAPVTTSKVGQQYRYVVQANDPDGDPLNYALVLAPGGMTIDPTSGQIDWTPSQAGTESVKLTVMDDHNQEASQEFVITVVTCDNPPEVTSTPVLTATEGQPYAYQVEAGGIGTLVYSLQVAPEDMSIDASTGLIAWTPSYTAHGMRTVKVCVSKGGSPDCRGEQIFQIDVADVNAPPQIVSAAVTTAAEGVAYRYPVQGIDPDGDVLAYSLVKAPAGMTIHPLVGMIEWTPSQTAAAGSPYSVTVKVTDPGGKSGQQTYSLTVTADDQAPRIISSPVYGAVESELYQYQVIAVDPDDDPLTYVLESAPAGMAVDAATGLIEWMPDQQAADHNPYEVHVVVSDPAGHTANQAFEIFVRVTNVAPVITSVPPVSAVEGQIYVYHTTATDEDGDQLTYALSVKPSGMNIHPLTGAIDWLVPQTAAAHAPYAVTVVVTDGVAATEQAFLIDQIQAVNAAPGIFSEPVTVAAVGATYSYDVFATDPDEDTLTYILGQAPDGMVIDAATGMITWVPAAGQDGDQIVQVVVSDPAGLTAEQQFVIVTAKCADAPEFTSAPKTSASPNIQYVYDVEAKVRGGTIAYSLSSAPDGMTIDSASGVINWTPGDADMGPHQVVVLATRDGVCSNQQAFEVDVRVCELSVSYPLPVMVPGQTTLFVPQAVSNCEPLTYDLLSGPQGMVIDAASGQIHWTPVVGHFTAEVRVTDAWGTPVLTSFEGDVTPQSPPRITSTPPFTAQPDTQYVYQVTATDDDGDALTITLPTAPAGMTLDADAYLITWTPSQADIGTRLVEVKVTDARGAWVTQSFGITVSQSGTNRAPEITSTPVPRAFAGIVYDYQAVANDPDGDTLSWSISDAPSGMVIDPDAGLVHWEPTAADVGTYNPSVRATDPQGAWASQTFSLTVRVNTPPQIVSQPVTKAIVAIAYRYPVKATDPDETDLSYSLTGGPDGMSIDESTGVISWIPDAGQIGDHAVSVLVRDSAQAEAAQEYTLTVHADPSADTFPPEVAVTATPSMVNPGQAVKITVKAIDDFGIASLEVKVNDEVIALDAESQAAYTPQTSGAYVVRAVATDLAGRTGQGTADFFARTPGDSIPPTVALTTPAADTTIKVPTEVIGTASDDNFYKYTLSYRGVGQPDFIEFAVGYSPVVNGVLGRIDPTLMVNGMYEFRLQAADTNGNVNTIVATYMIAGDMKVGNFTLSFIDLDVPAPGLPITLTRTYDSRVKSKGDFGIGWRLDITSLKVEENVTPGKDWQQQMIPGLGGMNRYVLSPIKPHLVSVTWPDGRTEQFAMSVVPSQQMFMPISFFDRIEFVPVPPATSKLTVLGDTSGYYDGGAPGAGDLYLYSESTAFDPGNYRLTTADGKQYDLGGGYGSPTAKLQGIKEPNGNTLSITAGGIMHSSGEKVNFERDSANRITMITDLRGGRILFEYDSAGDLVSATNQKGEVTRFAYNGEHGLIEIISPNGQGVARNVYDDDGRLIATIDALGNRVEFEHNLSARQEVVRDRLGNPTVHEYDDNGNVIATTNALGERTEHTYDTRGNKLTETNPLGHTKTYSYDARNNILTETDGLGNRTEYTYNSLNKLLTRKDAEGRVTANTYDAKGNLTSTTDPLGNVSSYTYDTAGNMVSSSDPMGKVTSYTYDSVGRMLARQDPSGARTTYTYDAAGNRLTETRTRKTAAGDEEQLVTRNVYDELNRIIETTDAAGNVRRTEYDTLGKISAVVDQRGNRVEYEYDVRGNLVRKTLPDGHSEVTAYDAEGRRLSVTGLGGQTTRFEYDAVGRAIRTIMPDGAVVASEYDEAGRVIKKTDPRGNATVFEYDAAGRNTKATDALGYVVTKEYDKSGLLLRQTDALGRIIRQEYDGAGRLVRTIYPDGSIVSHEYNAAGQKLADISNTGSRTTYEYDAAGRLTTLTDPMGNVTRYAYDGVGNRVAQTDADGHTTRYEYDEMGRQTGQVLPLGMTETLAHNEMGQIASQTDANGNTIAFEYDADGRLARKILPDGQSVVYTYTASGREQTVTDNRGVTSSEYDRNNRLIRRTDPDGAAISYTYDLNGNRTSVTTAAGTTSYTYDVLNRMATVIDPDGGVTAYAYDAVGNRIGVTNANGTTTQYTYDVMNRLTSLVNRGPGGQVLSSYVYTLGPAGNRTRVVENTGRTVDYQYDDLFRLTKETINDPGTGLTTISYTYDNVGNRLSKTVATTGSRTVWVYTYDANDRLLSEQRTMTLVAADSQNSGDRYVNGGTPPSRNAHYGTVAFLAVTLGTLFTPFGMLTSRPRGVGRRFRRQRVLVQTIALFVLPLMAVTPQNVQAMSQQGALYMILGTTTLADTTETSTYAYDNNGNTLSKTVGTKIDAFTYDPENRLVAADIQTGSQPGTVNYGYDQDGMRVSKTAGGVTTKYLVDKNQKYAQVLMETTGSDAVSYVRGDDLISMKRTGGAVRYYHIDGQSSTRQLTDSAANVTDTYDFDAFGSLLGRTGTTVNDFMYTGQQYDPNVGFYYLRARYMNPGLGRFLSADPFRQTNIYDPQAFHKYTYAYNSPVELSDPTGLATLMEIAVVISIISVLFLIFGTALITAPAKALGLPLYTLWNMVQIMRAPQAIQTEAARIFYLFQLWSAATHWNWQGTFTIGPAGYLFGREWACGDHVQHQMEYYRAHEWYPFKHFHYRIYETNVSYKPGSGGLTSATGLVHTYLVAHEPQYDITINLDSWFWGFIAPMMPAPYLGSVDVSDSANYSGYYGSAGPPPAPPTAPAYQAPAPTGGPMYMYY